MSSFLPAELAAILDRLRASLNQNRFYLDGAVTGCVAAVLVLLGGVLIVRSEPQAEVEVRLADGSAWLASYEVSGLSLLDGTDASIATSLGVAESGQSFSVVQWGSDALVVNQSAGTVSRLDGADWTIATGRVQFGEPGVELDVVVGGQVGWLLQPDSVTPLNPETLELRASVQTGTNSFDAAVAENGSLLYSSTDPEVSLRRYSADARSSSSVSGLSGPVALNDLGGYLSGVDLDNGAVWLEGSGIVCDDLDLDGTGATTGAFEHAVGGSDGTLLAVSNSGAVALWAPERGCPTQQERVWIEPGKYGTPVVTQGWGVILDLDQNDLVLVDLASGQATTRISLGDDSLAGLQLVAETGSIWFNDVLSPLAGLVERSGALQMVAKYDPGSGAAFVSAPTQSGAADMALSGVAEQPQETASDELTVPAAPTSDPVTTPEPEPSSPFEISPLNGEVDPLGPVLEEPGAPTPTDPAPSPTTTPPVTVAPPLIDVQLAATATRVTTGSTVLFRSQTRHGSPDYFEFSVTPHIGTTGSTSSSDEFRYTFSSVGNYFVTVRACDADNNCDTETVAIEVLPDGTTEKLFAAIVAPTLIAAGESATLGDASQGSPTSWQWTMSGATPSSSTDSSPTVRFDAPGEHQIKLRIKDASGATSTATLTLSVLPAAALVELALSGPTSVESGVAATYSVVASNGSTPSELNWTAPGAQIQSASGTTATIVFDTAGSHTIAVSASVDQDTLSDNLDVTVTVPPPTVQAPHVSVSGPTELMIGQSGAFVLTNSGGPATDFSWQSTGERNGSGATVSFTFDEVGTHTVRGSATGVGGTDNAQMNVVVTAPPPDAAPFGMSCDHTVLVAAQWSTCTLAGDATDFSDINWSVEWPDEANANSWSASETEFRVGYLAAGSVTVTLRAVDNGTGATRSDTQVITYSAPPVLAPSIMLSGPASVSTQTAATFTSSNTGGAIDSYVWTSDGQPGSTGATLQAAWSEPGTYSVQLRVSGPGGSDIQTVSIVVTEPTPSSFTLSCPTPVLVGNISYCQLVGDPSAFSDFSWSIAWPDAALSESWNGELWTMNVGYGAAASFGVTLSATDKATGQLVTASATVTFE